MATFETRAASSKEKEDSFWLDQVLTWVPFFGAVSPSLLNLPYTLQLFLYLFLVQRQKQLFVWVNHECLSLSDDSSVLSHCDWGKLESDCGLSWSHWLSSWTQVITIRSWSRQSLWRGLPLPLCLLVGIFLVRQQMGKVSRIDGSSLSNCFRSHFKLLNISPVAEALPLSTS